MYNDQWLMLNFQFSILSTLLKVIQFGLKSLNMVFINNPSLKAGVNKLPDISGFSPKQIVLSCFSEPTQFSMVNFQFSMGNGGGK